MFTLAIAYCLAGELPALNTCRVETLPLWFATEEACVRHLNGLSNSQFIIVDASCDEWTSMNGLENEAT